MTNNPMTSRTAKHPPVTRESVVADLRRLADLAEANGDRASAVRALKVAWRIERRAPANPMLPSVDTIIAIGEDAAALAGRFDPEAAAAIKAAVADLKAGRLELAEAEKEIATLH
ncbi:MULTISPECIES: hypothetical protein [Rhizobium]|uniref:hypothetical protein n=1 Tax=Rhizobium TaxID=379 RepID=UPI0010322A01|nr:MULTISPECIES: hypothetical protein [Rhizobium]QIO64845.1 hypothetical protein HA462_07230 [Rhizobium leguminosarum bv. trifolii]TBC98996.1 hypothetical protein ELH25_10095 [Rhizobium ruizarguesonis]TBE32876.1 hypothetical protein ELH07_09525 [Rhizobium ruizarguesonis]